MDDLLGYCITSSLDANRFLTTLKVFRSVSFYDHRDHKAY